MLLRLRELATAEIACRTRLPFRFGTVTVTAAPLLHLRLLAETADGRTAVGMASDLLVPKWFRKDVDRSAAADQQALRESVRGAADLYRERGLASTYAHWSAVESALVDNEVASHPELLERGFGIALVERALIDAACRIAQMPFHEALPSGLLGRRFELAATPLQRIAVRHTVGRLDPLRAADIPTAERLDDGMPQALDSVLQQHGVRWLKVKIGGGHDDDVRRLSAIGSLLDELVLVDVRVTLDGNEQIADFAALGELWRATDSLPGGRSLLRRVQWVEQPLPRAQSLTGARPDWPFCALVLDEADAKRSSWQQSGYDGVSVKNCKGVFRALQNRDAAAAAGGARFQSSEDLTNLPVLSVQQDLCTAAVLGLTHSERNGHHYFPGLDHLPTAVVEAALAAHPDLYERTPRGGKLRIENGAVGIASLLYGVGYGCAEAVRKALDGALDWSAEPAGP